MERDWLEYATGVGAIVTPLLVLLLTGLGWHIKSKLESSRAKDARAEERIRKLEDKLRGDRVETYNLLLEPFFVLFTSDEVFAQDPKYKGKKKDQVGIGMMLTVEYRRVGFKLALLADDSVVRAYNKLMQFFYKGEHDGLEQHELMIKTSQWIELLAQLLLEIRRSMGNANTDLSKWEMIEWFMSEVDKMREMSANSSFKPKPLRGSA